MASINYAKYAGYHSLAAAIVFAILYAPLFLWFLFKSIRLPTYVHFVLTFFCLIRIAGFVIRAILVGSESAGTSLGLLQADQILFGVGYFGLLYSAYTLVLNLEQVANDHESKQNLFIALTQNRRVFRLTMLIGVALGIAASSSVNSDGSFPSSSVALREASTIIFLVLTAMLVLQTLYFARIKMMHPSASINQTRQDSFGAKHGIFILVVISLILLVREIFVTATMTPSSHVKQYNENYWYPFIATTEILAVICYLAPGLVPSAKEIQERTLTQNQEHDITRKESP